MDHESTTGVSHPRLVMTPTVVFDMLDEQLESRFDGTMIVDRALLTRAMGAIERRQRDED